MEITNKELAVELVGRMIEANSRLLHGNNFTPGMTVSDIQSALEQIFITLESLGTMKESQ